MADACYKAQVQTLLWSLMSDRAGSTVVAVVMGSTFQLKLDSLD
jgi:hypothetical protein